MPKVVINRCYGGFSVSRECAEHMAAAGSESAKKMLADAATQGRWYGYFHGGDETRADPLLVGAVEALGAKASGHVAKLEVVDVPDDAGWRIEEYDGYEHVAENHRTW